MSQPIITNELEEILNIQLDMEKDIKADIYGCIYGHERWAEEIFRLRSELRRMNEKAIEDSWARNPDRSGGQFSDAERADYLDRNLTGGW